MSSYQDRDSHVKDKTVSPTVLLLIWESHTWERRSLHWDGAQSISSYGDDLFHPEYSSLNPWGINSSAVRIINPDHWGVSSGYYKTTPLSGKKEGIFKEYVSVNKSLCWNKRVCFVLKRFCGWIGDAYTVHYYLSQWWSCFLSFMYKI